MPGHDDEFADEGTEIDVDALVLIVVGAHPKAEMFDRTIAYRLRQRMIGWLDQRFPTGGPRPLLPLVCSDVWYLNDQSLRERPAVAVGGPGVNALSAYLADKLPSAFVIDDVLMVQMDLEQHQNIACCWGLSPSDTSSAVDVFTDRYLDAFMRSSLGQEAA
ncbi:MAG TPA: hypothetical protein PL072_01975 [Phycisphaerales bacterium]|jgi:hypothetical protein|nr:hypothetical protein [Phycisphaerales bacterium]HPO92214.1 hypothetical protein [Phycisphaerales bacterium]